VEVSEGIQPAATVVNPDFLRDLCGFSFATFAVKGFCSGGTIENAGRKSATDVKTDHYPGLGAPHPKITRPKKYSNSAS
jgi:hypothetical protein